MEVDSHSEFHAGSPDEEVDEEVGVVEEGVADNKNTKNATTLKYHQGIHYGLRSESGPQVNQPDYQRRRIRDDHVTIRKW